MPQIPSDVQRPRERILLAARDLFHRHGIRGVGVETIAETAGTNKMTLYRHFDSKDDLIVAYLRGVATEADEMWREIENGHPGDMIAQLKAWLILAEECVNTDGRGCDLANAAVESTRSGSSGTPHHRGIKDRTPQPPGRSMPPRRNLSAGSARRHTHTPPRRRPRQPPIGRQQGPKRKIYGDGRGRHRDL